MVDPGRFPAPSAERLTPLLGDKELAYLAYLALLRADPEVRVLATLLLRLYEELSGSGEEPPNPKPRP